MSYHSALIRSSRASLRALCVAFAALVACAAHADGLFAPAIVVNDDVITNYEIRQRAQLVQILGSPGNPTTVARNALIEDRLKKQAMAQYGIDVSEEDLSSGIEEFAQRADLSTEEFLKVLAQNGVAAETFRDFISISVGWRDLVRGLFLERARPSQEEIDRAMGGAGGSGGLEVLMSEVIIPVTPENAAQTQAVAEDVATLTSTAAFSDAARRYSASPTRDNGGRLPWMALTELPAPLRPVLLALSPGEVSQPLPLGGGQAIALFQLRDLREVASAPPRYAAIEYATYLIPGGRGPDGLAKAAEITAETATCDDLYRIAQGQPEEVLTRTSLPPSEIPRDIALELSKLDPGEVSTTLTRNNGQTLLYLMLCGRTIDGTQDADRQSVAQALTARRLEASARNFLDQLRADALIVEK